MLLLDRQLAAIEQPRLAVVVSEAVWPQPLHLALMRRGERPVPTLRIFTRPAVLAPAVRLIIGATSGIAHRHMAVLLEVHHRTAGRIDRNMGEVRRAEPLQLRI